MEPDRYTVLGVIPIPGLVRCSTVYFEEFKRTGHLGDISKAISILWRAVDIATENTPALPGMLSDLGGYLGYQFEHSGDLQDVVEAISVQQKAIILTPESHVHLPAQLSNVGNSFLYCFNRTGDLQDLCEALSC